MTVIEHDNARRVRIDRAIELAIATGVAVLVVIGFVTSYETLRNLAVSDGGFAPWLAPAVPLSFDLGIIVLSLKIVAAAREGRHAVVHRALVAVLSTATVAVNSTASNGTAGQLLHAIPPAMFVICFEGLIADARRDALASRRPRAGRWKAGLLAPIKSMRTWREEALGSSSPSGAGRSATRPTRTSHQARPGAGLSEAREQARTQLNAGGPDDRLTLAREALRDQPDLTAPALARALRDHGYEVSVRTAQRLKARLSEAIG
jgi:Protein of unknown function (DUF2637)